MRIFAPNNEKSDSMYLKGLLNKTIFLIGCVVVIMMASCSPQTPVERISALERQVKDDAKDLTKLEAKQFAKLQNDFIACDSMLQFLHPEQMEESFLQLQLVSAYIEQFKATRPAMQAEMDTTLLQLKRLKADIESHYLSDSLAALYIDDETQQVERLTNQVEYFRDRFRSSQKELNTLKKMRQNK